MAMITTFEAETSPITIDDLFKVNDFFGIKLFGNYWPQIKQAAAQIAQKAVDAPIMFYVRSLGNENQVPGQSSTLGRALWGYNDAAGVELLGSATWSAVKGEMDELLGWNIFSAARKVAQLPLKVGEYVGTGLQKTGLPVVSDVGAFIKSTSQTVQNLTPTAISEKTVNLATGKGFVTQEEIEAAERAAEKKRAAYQSAYQSGVKAGEAAAAAARAQAEFEAAQKAASTATNDVTDVVTTVTPSMSDGTKKLLIIGGVGLGAYLLLRRRGRRR